MRSQFSGVSVIQQFREASLGTQLLLDTLLPLIFGALGWMANRTKCWLWFSNDPNMRQSSKETLVYLTVTYFLMFALTIYVHFWR
jgi:hypothetical protein